MAMIWGVLLFLTCTLAVFMGVFVLGDVNKAPYIFICLIPLLITIVLLFQYSTEKQISIRKALWIQFKKSILTKPILWGMLLTSRLFKPPQPEPNTRPSHYLISSFKNHYSNYYSNNINHHDTQYQHNLIGLQHALQGSVNQPLWQSLALHKRRLKQFDIELECTIKRRKINVENSLITQTKSHSNIAIDEVWEGNYTTHIYRDRNQKLLSLNSEDLAYYEVYQSPQAPESLVYCPNCGSPSSVEGLLDGCDYCSTQYKVQDIGLKIGRFLLVRDTRILFWKIRRILEQLFAICFFVFLITNAISTTRSLYQLIWFTEGRAPEMSIILSDLPSYLFLWLAAIYISFIYVAMYAIASFWLYSKIVHVIYWINEFWIKFMIAHAEKKRYNPLLLKNIHSINPTFTYHQFYASVIHKLANIYYAKSPKKSKAYLPER